MNRFGLNQRAQTLCDSLDEATLQQLRISRRRHESGATIFDFGVESVGSLAAGVLLSRICAADLLDVSMITSDDHPKHGPDVVVRTDQPIEACIASQYAGWQIQHNGFFGMGSGPMRVAAAREEIVKELHLSETAESVVGVLESSQIPGEAMCEKIAADCQVAPDRLTLCVARTASLCGTFQVVARSVETAMHKLHELKFDLQQVVAGFGNAPLPPVAADDLVGIGRTNDAILYGGKVTLWVSSGDDQQLSQLVEQVPSAASHDFGKPFIEIFKRYDGDFYKIDPLLFSPAVFGIVNLQTGNSFAAGQVREDVLETSFA